MPAPEDLNSSDQEEYLCTEKDAAVDGSHLLHAPGTVDGATASTSAPGLGGNHMTSSWWW